MTNIKCFRYLTIILLAVVFLTPSIALATEDAVSSGNDQHAQTAGVTVEAEAESVDFDLGDTDALYEQYVNQLFYGNPDGSKPAAVPKLKAKKITGDRLEGQDKILYDALKDALRQIADGKLDSAIIEIPVDMLAVDVKSTYTAEDLGLEDPSYLYDPVTKKWNPAVRPKMDELFNAMFRFDGEQIFECLMADCPYEKYWSMEHCTYPTGISYHWEQYEDGTEYIRIMPFKFKFKVDPKYRADSENEYSADTEKTGAAAAAVQCAQGILDDAAAKDDYCKLVFYKDAICDLVDYNSAAMSEGSENDMGPWALVYVFDGNPDTDVVCEGYSEAFQYLCGRTDFESEEISAYTVRGDMGLLSKEKVELHQWNIVHMDDGNNYIADITNSDEGSIGKCGDLFLAGMEGSVAEGYRKTINKSTIQFRYDEDTRRIFTEDELTLSDYIYCDAHAYGEWTTQPATPAADGVIVRQCENCGRYETQATIFRPARYTFAAARYNGKVQRPKLTIRDSAGAVIPASNYTVTYPKRIAAGTAKATITFKGNYSGKISKSFTIAKAANPLYAKGRTATVKAKKVKKKAQTLLRSKVVTVSRQHGKITYVKVSGSKKLTIAKTTGKVTVKKKTKKGTYRIRVRVTSAGTTNYKAGSRTVTITVKLK